MRYVAAYLLAVLGSNQNPTQSDIDKILSSVGIESDSERVKKVIGELSGKSIEDLIAQGQTKLASMPSGGGAAVASTGASAPAETKKEEKKKEEKKESEDEEDDDMGFGLFD